MSDHRRRDGYWQYYHLAHTLEKDAIVRNIVDLVKENPLPREKKSRGRKPIHSLEKMVCICMLMVVFGLSYRKMQNEVPYLNLPWNEPYPDHTWIAKTFSKIPLDYLESILHKTASICMQEAKWTKGILGVDSTGIETDRYDERVRPVKSKRRFETMVKRFLKWHIVAILDHMIILASTITSGNVHDSSVLRRMLKSIKPFMLHGSVMNADRAYDSEINFQSVYGMHMNPNIRQRDIAFSKKFRFRKKASGEFNVDVYHYRGLIEGIFGAEEKANYQLHCRYIIKQNQQRFGIIKSIGWNLRILNRLVCAKELRIKILPYAIAN